jgi:hypothetical protein
MQQTPLPFPPEQAAWPAIKRNWNDALAHIM